MIRTWLASVILGGAVATGAQASLLTNGDFEAGDLSGWQVTDLAGGAGTWYADDVGTTTPISASTTSAAGGGAGTYAVTDQSGPGTHILTQSFFVPVAATGVFLSFDLFANSYGGGPLDNGSLDHTAGDAQHARVDILTDSAGVFSVTPADIVVSLLSPFIDPEGSNPNPFTAYFFDLSGILLPGESYQLRFAEVDNQLFFNMGVDNVLLEARTAAVSTPGSLALLLLGVALLVRRSGRSA